MRDALQDQPIEAQVVSDRRGVLSSTREGHDVLPLRQAWPPQHAILADEELCIVRIDREPRPHVRTRLVLELRPCPWRLAVDEHGPGAVVLRFSYLRDELVPSVLGNIERDVDARPDTFALEEQNVLSPEDLFLDGDLSLRGDGFALRTTTSRSSSVPRSTD